MSHLILIGYMGAGKTTVGKECARQLGRAFEDTDYLIEKKAGKTVSRIFETEGEFAFRRMETEVLLQLESTSDSKVIATGGGLPLRKENREILKRLGIVVYLEVKTETVMERLKGDTTRPLLQYSDREQRIEKMLRERDGAYRLAADLVITADGTSPEQIFKELERHTGGKL